MTNHTTAMAELRRALVVRREDLRWLAWNAGLLAAYWAVLAYSYVHAIAPVNASEFSMYLRPNPTKEIEGMVWAVLLLPTVNTDWKRPSDFGLTLLYFIGLIPALIIYGLADQPRLVMQTIVAGYFSVYVGCKVPLHIPYIRLRQGGQSGIYLAAVGVLIIASWFAIKGDKNNFNINLFAVYDYRTAAESIFDVGPLAYLASWTPRVLNPILFSYFLLKKKWFLFSMSFLYQLFSLVIFQEKSVFIPCLMLPLLYFAQSGRHGRVLFVLSLAATIIFCEIMYERYDFVLFSQLWTRRFFFDQQFLYFNYYEIFKKIGLVYYSDSFLSGIIHYPFPYPPANMVGYYMFGMADQNANTGFMGAGYMELGTIGIVLSGLLAGLTLKLFDRITSLEIPMWFFGTVAFLPFMAMLIAQNFFTSILTGGGGVLLILMLCIKRLDLHQEAQPSAG